jgi:RHS repeat-associated protein
MRKSLSSRCRRALVARIAALFLTLAGISLMLVLAMPSRGQSGGSGGSFYCGCYQQSGPSAKHAGDPVELWRGAVEWSQTDLAVGGPVPMHLRRHYCTLDFSAGPLGPGTSMDYDVFVVMSSRYYGNYEVITPRNRRSVFEPFGGYTLFRNTTDPEYAGCRLQVPAFGSLDATLTYPDGAVLQFNSSGALVSSRDRLGVGLNFSRNENGYITSISNTQNSYAINIAYGADGLASSATETALNRTVQYAHGVNQCISSVIDAAGGVTTYTWNNNPYGGYQAPGLLTVTDPRGVQLLTNTYETNGQGRVLSQRLGNGGTWSFEYQDVGGGSRITRVRDANSNLTSYHLAPVRYYTYCVADVTSPLNRTTLYSYAATGPCFLTGVTDFRGRSVTLDWDANGNLLAIHRPTVSGGTATTSFEYDPILNELVSTTDELGQTTQVTLNTQGLPETVAWPWGAAEHLVYNQAGQVTQYTDTAGGVWSTEYGSDGLPISQTNPLNQVVTAAYSGTRLQQITDALQRVVSFTHSPMGRLASVSGPAGSGYSLLRDPANHVTGLNVNSGAQHRWTLDGSADPVSGTDPAGATETVTRDANGNPIVTVDRKGQREQISYGSGDRVQQVVFKRPDGSIESTLTYNYDPNTDLLVSISDSAGPGCSYTYNSLDEVTAISGPEGITGFLYDDLGRLTSAQAPGQAAVEYFYDLYGRLSSVRKGADTLTYQWDNSTGRLSSVTRPNGIGSQLFYDSLWRVNRIEHRLNGNLLEYEAYAFDAGGRVTARERNGVSSSFGHDLLDQLSGYTIPGQTASLVYDAAGNRTSQTVNGVTKALTYNLANRLTNDGGLAVVHDANGNIVQYGSAALTWDARGRLAQVSDGGTVTSFLYDCFNRRVTKTVNGVTKRYVWLGDDLAAEADASWSQTASYFYEPGVDLPISRTDAAGTVYYLQDHAGSVTALARPDGSLIGRYAYTPWGEVAADPGMPAQPLLWTGRELDETGLYYLRGRYYLPSIGRFLSEDPAGLEANLNLYQFALNGPLGRRDPFGLIWGGLEGDGILPWVAGGVGKEAMDDSDPFDVPNKAMRMSGALDLGVPRFKDDPMWNPNSPERNRFSQGLNIIPPVAAGKAAYGALTGNDPVAGRRLSGLERGVAVVSTVAAAASAVGRAIGPKLSPYRPNPEGPYPYTQLRMGRGGRFYQGMTYDEQGYAVRRTDLFSASGRRDHPFPHFHDMEWEGGQRHPGGNAKPGKAWW